MHHIAILKSEGFLHHTDHSGHKEIFHSLEGLRSG